MDRLRELTKHVTKDKIGIEVGPWHSPIVSKREGYNCLVLDYFPAETLRDKARADSFVPNERIQNIEEVDLLGSSTEIGDLVREKGLAGKIDYIISSHNFEHLPNPIRFLQGCDRALKPGGLLSMAVPDRRTCFDYFRPHTTLSAWLEAYFTGRQRPSFTQIFEQNALDCRYYRDGAILLSFFLPDDPACIAPTKTLRETFNWWKTYLANPDTTYYDTHCSTFTPASFELLMRDLAFLGLTQLQLRDIVPETNAHEFYVHLQRPEMNATDTEFDLDSFYEKRRSLLHRINSEAGANSIETFRMKSELKRALSRIDEQQMELAAVEKNANDFRAESHVRIRQLEAVVDGIVTSKSWRLTAPIRAIVAGLRQLRQ